MAKQLRISTTGTIASITINDLFATRFVHPITNLVLAEENNSNYPFTLEQIILSTDLAAALTAGYITLSDESSNPVTDVTTSANNTITNALLAQVATSTMKGRLTTGTGNVEDLTVANVKTLLAYTKGDISLGSVENTALSTWAGTSNVITLGTVTTGTWSASTIAANKGGTGNSVYVVGDLLQASTTTALSTLAAVATGNVLISGGIGTISTWGKIGLTSHISGILAIANGGTNSSTSLNSGRVMISTGGAIVENSALTTSYLVLGGTSLSSLTIGTANQILGVINASGSHEYKTLSVGTTGTDFNIVLSAANSIVFHLPDASASNRGAITTGTQTIAGSKTFSSALTINPTTNQIVLGVTNTVTITSPAPAASRTYTLPDTLANSSFVMTDLAQTLNGIKTHSSQIVITPTTNQLVLGVTNTTTISATAPVASRVYTIPDTAANSSFVMTDLAQTLNGIKYFTTAVKSQGLYPNADSTTALQLRKADGSTSVVNIDTTNSRMFIGGNTAPTATLHLAAGTNASGGAPLKLTSGTLTTAGNISDGAIEYNGTHAYITIGSTRYQLDQQHAFIDLPIASNLATVSAGTNSSTLASNTFYIHHTGTGNNQTCTRYWKFIVPSHYVSGAVINTHVAILNAVDTFTMSAYINGVVDATIDAVNIMPVGATPELKQSTFGSTLVAGDSVMISIFDQVDNTESARIYDLYVTFTA